MRNNAEFLLYIGACVVDYDLSQNGG